MENVSRNIFDLSALPKAKQNLELKTAGKSDETTGLKFDMLFGGMVADPTAPKDTQQVKLDLENGKLAAVLAKSQNSTKTVVKSLAEGVNPKAEVKTGLERTTEKNGSLVNPTLSLQGEKVMNRLIREASMLKSDSTAVNVARSTVLGAKQEPQTNIKSIENGLLANQSEARFTIDKMTVVGDELQIEAKSLGDSTNKIKLVVPKQELSDLKAAAIDQKTQIASKQATTQNRVPLEGLPEPTAKLDDLLEKLNLKELIVKNDQTVKDPSVVTQPTKQSATVKLISVENAAEFTVKGEVTSFEQKSRLSSNRRLAPKGVDLSSVQNSNRSSANQNSATGGNGRVSLVNSRTSDGGMVLQEVKVRSEAVDLLNQFAADETPDEMNSEKTIASLNTGEAGSSKLFTVRQELPQVKFGLPDDIGSSLIPGGKSVTIRIHPEILGPVRLSMRLSGDQMHVRLVVDSVQIKSMIESSLDQLTHQLEEAGIKVDQMDVNVAGSDIGGGLFERAAMQSRPKMSYRTLEAEEAELLSTLEATPSRSSGEYVTASGVNLFA